WLCGGSYRNQRSGVGFQFARQLVETRLALPDVVTRVTLRLLHLRVVLPGLTREFIKPRGTGHERLRIEYQTPTQHAAEVLLGIQHRLIDRLALAQRRNRVDAITTSQRQQRDQRQTQRHQSHGSITRQYESRRLSLLAPDSPTLKPFDPRWRAHSVEGKLQQKRRFIRAWSRFVAASRCSSVF